MQKFSGHRKCEMLNKDLKIRWCLIYITESATTLYSNLHQKLDSMYFLCWPNTSECFHVSYSESVKFFMWKRWHFLGHKASELNGP